MTPRTDPTLAELEEQIARTREALGQTVEELAAKVDVPTRAKAKARETADRFRAAEDRTRSRAGNAAAAMRSRLPGGAGAEEKGGEGQGGGPWRGVPAAESGAHRAELTAAGPAGSSGAGAHAPTATVAAVGLAVLIAVTWARSRAER